MDYPYQQNFRRFLDQQDLSPLTQNLRHLSY